MLDPIIKAKVDERLNSAEFAIAQMQPVEIELTHRFTPGLCSREMRAPEAAWLATKIHKTEHQWVLSSGIVAVYTSGKELVEVVEAPAHGITVPGTRRLFLTLTPAVWTTFHPTTETDVAKLEALLIEPHDAPAQVNGPAYREIEGGAE